MPKTNKLQTLDSYVEIIPNQKMLYIQDDL